jgi:hypothetical protein
MKPTLINLSLSLVSFCALQQQTVLAWREHLHRAFLLPVPVRVRQRSRVFPLRGGATPDDSTKVLLTPYIEDPDVWAKEKRALILMDIFAEFHGMYLSHRAKEAYGVATVVVFSNYMKGYFEGAQAADLDQLRTMCMPAADELKDWRRHLEGIELVAISCESDSGLADAERFGVSLNLTHHCGINEARRHKFLMNEAVSSAGLPVVRQRLCGSNAEARKFANKLGMEEVTGPASSDKNPLVVVKPVRGVASDDVFLCRDFASVDEAFSKIHGSTVFGSPSEKHEEVLVQEFASGQEYAIDIISKNGEHKVAAVWKYDKRPANGASFVYFATKIYDGKDASVVCDYAKQCLDALDVKWGFTHNEVIMTAHDEPRLVEVNCRQHNMDFYPLAMACIGYNAFDMLLAAYLGGQDPASYPPNSEGERLDWDLLPEIPSKRRNGAMVHLVNYARGTLAYVNEAALMEIQSMESVLDLEVYGSFLELGNEITPTLDIRSDAGWVQLVNDDPEAFQRDYARIVELMPTLFEVEDES